MKKWSNEEIEMLNILVLENKTSKEIGIILNRTNRSVERKMSVLKIYRIKKEKVINICKECDKEIIGNGVLFCSNSCAASYNNKKRDKLVYEKVSKKLVELYRENVILRKCKYCYSEFETKKRNKVCDECKKWSGYIELYKKIGFFKKGKSLSNINKQSIGFLSDLYYNKGYSKIDLKNNFNVDTSSIYYYFKKNGLILRNSSEATSNAILLGKIIPHSYMYKSGWHVSWENKKLFYRSSYELGYAKYLDENKISYDMEFKRIVYFNTNENKNRIAIPDFYLPLENKIVEVKSEYTYDEIEMNDKSKKYLELGYSFELLLEEDLKKLNIKLK